MEELIAYLRHVPAVTVLSTSAPDEARWWVKLKIDLQDCLAWRVVQELGHVLNELSLDEPLPTVFKPVSPPPYMNGRPEAFLSWIIEPTDASMRPETVAKWLEGRLPRPVSVRDEWTLDEEESEA